MAKVKLGTFAFARSGDKGDGSNVGVFVTNAKDYELIKQQLTVARVKQHFHAICKGEVTRYEAPNMLALNFLLRDSLGGGGSESLKTDAQGKTHGLGLLEIEVDR
ncbi:MAG: hypothetical protein ACK501_01820 [Planctomycetota bacterium]|jgi:hypothetical protein|nr:hypothetical protein [Planctomycetota bacterium]